MPGPNQGEEEGSYSWRFFWEPPRVYLPRELLSTGLGQGPSPGTPGIGAVCLVVILLPGTPETGRTAHNPVQHLGRAGPDPLNWDFAPHHSGGLLCREGPLGLHKLSISVSGGPIKCSTPPAPLLP